MQFGVIVHVFNPVQFFTTCPGIYLEYEVSGKPSSNIDLISFNSISKYTSISHTSYII